MIKTVRNSVLAAALLGTSAVAGTVTAPNSVEVEFSGDAELKLVQEKSGNETVDKRTAEINLNFDAKTESGIDVYTSFKVFDGTQAATAGEDIDDGFSVTHAYATIPLFEKAKLIAGLAPNEVYGTDAFEDGGESWKLSVKAPIAPGVTVQLVSQVDNEEQADDNKGDSGSTALRVDGTFGDIQAGVKYAQGYMNKGDGLTGDPDTTEKEADVLTGYVSGSVAGVEFGAEYITKDITMVGAPTQPDAQTGFFVSAGTEISGISAGIAFVSLEKGLKGGEDFAPGIILDGNVDSSAAKDTSAFVVPVGYDFGNGLSVSAAYIAADVQGSDATEIDFGIGYAISDNAEFALDYGNYEIDGGDDQSIVEATIALTF